MKISYNFDTSTTMYNRTYAKNKVQAKSLAFKLTLETDKSVSAADLKNYAETIDAILDGGIVVSVQDPYMVQILEPKAGNTVHNRLNELKRKLVDNTYEIIGTTTPPETLNGYKVLVFGTGYTVTLEGLAEWVLLSFPIVTHIVISDGSVEVELDRSDVEHTD